MDVTMPRLGDSPADGLVCRWLKRRGDRVAEGEPLVEIEADKVNAEVESPCAGILAEVLFEEGATVPAGGVVARVTPADGR